MQCVSTNIPDVFILEPKIYSDERGYFYESFNEHTFNELISAPQAIRFVQDNHSKSIKNVLRGLHYQVRQPQGKLVRVVAGEVFDVAVDIRQSSPSFGQWIGAILSAENRRQMWIPAGFAHGFLVMSESAEFLYKTTDYWAPGHERCIAWNDPAVGIHWPLKSAPLLSEKDRNGKLLADAEVFA